MVMNNNDNNFNDVTDHQKKIEGLSFTKSGRLPLPIRIIGYFLTGGILLMTVIAFVANLVL